MRKPGSKQQNVTVDHLLPLFVKWGQGCAAASSLLSVRASASWGNALLTIRRVGNIGTI
jgi:hypothetical protein